MRHKRAVTRLPAPAPALAWAIAAAACASALPAAAQSTPATGKSVVLNPLSVVNTSDLDFGTLVRGTTAGTATVNPATGARSTTGGTTAAGGAPGPATFVATGVLNRLFIIALGSTPVLTNGTGGTMTANPLMIDGPTLRLFGGGGISTIRVGGVLNVGANQQEGNYTGTFNLTVIYL